MTVVEIKLSSHHSMHLGIIFLSSVACIIMKYGLMSIDFSFSISFLLGLRTDHSENYPNPLISFFF